MKLREGLIRNVLATLASVVLLVWVLVLFVQVIQ